MNAPLPGTMRRADYERAVWLYRAPRGTPFEAVLSPDFWIHWAPRLQVGDLIEIIAEDGSFDAELRVTKTERTYAKVRVLREWHEDGAGAEPQVDLPSDTNGYVVGFAGAIHKWRVVAPNGEILLKGFGTRGEAEASLKAFLEAKAA